VPPDPELLFRAIIAVVKLSALLVPLPLLLPLAAAERLYVGLAKSGERIEADLVPAAAGTATTVLLIGGLNGDDESRRIVNQEVRNFDPRKSPFHLMAIALANPDRSQLSFPPTGVAYRDNPVAHALWRWTAIQAPDLVLVVGNDGSGLADALSQNAVAGVGKIPARRVDAKPGILASLKGSIAQSEAHREIARRQARLPQQVAEELAVFYGHDFDQVTYLPAWR